MLRFRAAACRSSFQVDVMCALGAPCVSRSAADTPDAASTQVLGHAVVAAVRVWLHVLLPLPEGRSPPECVLGVGRVAEGLRRERGHRQREVHDGQLQEVPEVQQLHREERGLQAHDVPKARGRLWLRGTAVKRAEANYRARQCVCSSASRVDRLSRLLRRHCCRPFGIPVLLDMQGEVDGLQSCVRRLHREQRPEAQGLERR